MLSKSQLGLLRSLHHKKFRAESGLFLVEGYKSVIEFINSGYQVQAVYHTAATAPKLMNLSRKMNLNEISLTELERISTLKTPQDIIAAVKIPVWPVLDKSILGKKFSIVLDGVQDPGNMGTIIRTAHWFGIKNIICSADTVDVYNPKVVQASMGSLAQVNIYYTELDDFLTQIKLPVFGALLDGANIYQTDFGLEGLVVMGNEGNGIRPEIVKLIGKQVTIPRISNAESLNVGIATAIFCSEINRKSYQ